MVALGGRRDPGLPSAIASGSRPDVEYQRLLADTGAVLFDFDSLPENPLVTYLNRVIGPYWSTALASVKAHSADHVIIATGEDLGFRIALLHGYLRSCKRRPQISIICHGSYLNSSKAARLMRLLRHRPDVRFLCLSSSIAQQFIDLFGISHSCIDVIGYGVDIDFFKAAAVEAQREPRQVASAGMAGRDYVTLLRAIEGLDAELKIAADSTWFPVELDIDPAQVPPNAEIRSYGDYPALRALYAQSSVVVVPLHDSRHAAGYAVILEAMAMGRPVITTSIRGMSDFILDGVTGLLVAAGDADELRGAIVRLLDDPHLAEEIGGHAREWVEAHGSVAAYVPRIVRAACVQRNGSAG